MKTERWAQIERLFHRASELHPSEQEAFLEANCDDLSVAAEVRSLLIFSSSEPHTLEGIVQKEVASLPEQQENDTDLAGQRVGAYRLMKLLGRGGMGVVYLARRDDEEFEKTVAIKFINQTMFEPALNQLFKREREILARLEHPYIARLLDSGSALLPVLGHQVQYIVMEFVDGAPLNTYCSTHKLNLKDRLTLFQKICSAVQYAHQSLIVHQDLKPNNILVDGNGDPKLLDFGTARLLDSSRGETSFFAIHQVLTPSYASPEQVRGQPARVASDVYALGVILYQLLTGQKPYEPNTGTVFEWATLICEHEPQKPSEAVRMNASPTGKSALEGDLDTIILKALCKEASQRFASVQQFADDLDRYALGLPISARPATIGYRVTKFVRRNRVLLGAATLLGVVVIAGVAATVHQSRVAERRFVQVHKLTTRFLFDFYNQIENLPGATSARDLVVSTAQEYLDVLSREAQGDVNLQLDLADAYIKVGDVQGNPENPNLGRIKDARRSYKKASIIATAATRERPKHVRALRLDTLCLIRMGQIDSQTGHLQDAIQSLQRALISIHAWEQLPGAESASHELLPQARSALANAFWHNNQSDLALPLLLANQQLLDQKALLASATTAHRSDAATNLERTGDIYRDLGKLDLAAANMSRSALTFEELIAKDPLNQRLSRDLAHCYYQLSIIYGDPEVANLGKPAEAIEFTHKLRALLTKAIAADSKDSRLPYDLATSYSSEAVILQDSNPRKALDLYQQALDGFRALPDSLRSSRIYVQAQEAETQAQISHPLLKLGRRQDALTALSKAEAEVKNIVSAHPDELDIASLLIAILGDKARIYDGINDDVTADRLEREALSDALKLTAAAPSSEPFAGILAETYKSLAELAQARKDYAASCDFYHSELTLKQKWASSSKEMAAEAKQVQVVFENCQKQLLTRQ